MMGNFHLTKAAIHCLGKYTEGSEIYEAFIETGIFGPNIVEQVKTGSHYVRSIAGINMIQEAFSRLKWDAFWEYVDDSNAFGNEINEMQIFRQFLSDRNSEESRKKLDHILNTFSVEKLLTAFNRFVSKRCSESEICIYWENVTTIISIIKNLVKSDREGDFLLNIKPVG